MTDGIMVSPHLTSMTILFLTIASTSATHQGSLVNIRNTQRSNRRQLRKAIRMSTNESDEEPRQRVPISPFNITFSPAAYLALEDKNDIQVVVEDVVSSHVRDRDFPPEANFERILLSRDSANMFGGRYMDTLDNSIQFLSGAGLFQASDDSQLPSTFELDVWVKEAIEQNLVAALQETRYAFFHTVDYQSDSDPNGGLDTTGDPDSAIFEGIQEKNTDTSDGGGKSGNTVVGVVVGVVIAVGLLVAVVFVHAQKKKNTRKVDLDDTSITEEESTSASQDEEEGNPDETPSDQEPPKTPATRTRKTINLFVDFFQPVFALIYRSFSFLTHFAGPTRQADMIAR